MSYDIGCLRQDGILLSFSRHLRSLASLPLRPPPEKTVNLSLLSPRPASRNTRDFEWRGGVPPLNCKFPPCSLFRLDCAKRCCALRRVDRLSRLARSSFSTCSPHLKMSHITADPITNAQGLSTSIYQENLTTCISGISPLRGRAQLDSSRCYISAASWCRSCCCTSY